MNWYAPLRKIVSLGSQADRPGSLAGLAAARRIHLGQFFTPDDLALFMWKLAEPAMESFITQHQSRVTILDNSVGSGRLLQYADPEKHYLYGLDIDSDVVTAVGKAAEAAGFVCQFEVASLDSVKAHGFNVGLINPAFSVHLDSPFMDGSLPCTCYGKYGPSTAAVSHAYALAQAVDACELVVALLPSTFAEEVVSHPEQYLPEHRISWLQALIELPPKLFKEENTEVSVSVLVIGASDQPFSRSKIDSLDDVPMLGLYLSQDFRNSKPRLKVLGMDDEGPAITRPVTGNNLVHIGHSGRKISLAFHCGLTEARVLNALMKETIVRNENKRHPKGVRYTGQGVLDMEVHLAQSDPFVSFNRFIETVREAGGKPEVDPGLRFFLSKRVRETQRQATPLRHCIWVPDGVASNQDKITGKARKELLADPKIWGSPIIRPGQEIEFVRHEHAYQFFLKERSYAITPEELYLHFEVSEGAKASGWQVVHEGLPRVFPELATWYRKRAVGLGIDKWLTWGFQLDDLIELSMKPVGSIAAWDMGLGKARLGSALIMLNGCKHGLIVTEAGLLDEMRMELEGLPLPRSDWQIITSPDQVDNLTRINVIAYERLRMKVKRVNRKMTFGKYLRNRIGLMVADEGDVLANPDSDQSRALVNVSPKKQYILTGTPMGNYPRNILPIQAFACGDGTAANPWGWRRGFLEENWRNSMQYAERGIDRFVEKFVSFEWVSREFEDTLTQGAKREIPRIRNLEDFRKMLAPGIKRRILEEPEVAAHIHIPKHNEGIVELDWDPSHLAFYLRVAEEFSNWYQMSRTDRSMRNNLIVLLARLRAVSFASDYPQHGVEGFGAHMPLTSKQRWAIDELESLTLQGKKTLLYSENPGQVELIHKELKKRGVDSVLYHGGIPIPKRTKEMNERYRFGPCPNLLGTLGCTQKGLNLWQVEEILGISRSWSSSTERQAIKRALRPQQTKHVRVRWGHLRGGIDIYKHQIVSMKADCSQAGLDWGTPMTDDVPFLHLTTIISRFCDDLALMKGVNRNQLRETVEREALYA